jgi:enoyl-CoA hydratase
VTEVVEHERLLERAVGLATQIAEVPGPIMGGLKEIYVTGPAAIIDPALDAEQAIAVALQPNTEELGDVYRAVSDRNRRQIEHN